MELSTFFEHLHLHLAETFMQRYILSVYQLSLGIKLKNQEFDVLCRRKTQRYKVLLEHVKDNSAVRLF